MGDKGEIVCSTSVSVGGHELWLALCLCSTTMMVCLWKPSDSIRVVAEGSVVTLQSQGCDQHNIILTQHGGCNHGQMFPFQTEANYRGVAIAILKDESKGLVRDDTLKIVASIRVRR